MRTRSTACLLGACLACLQAASLDSNATVPSPTAASVARLTEAYGKLPLPFEPNLGQAPRGVRYLTRVPGATILLRDTEAVIEVRRVEANGKEQLVEPGETAPALGKVEGVTVRMRLAGATPPRRIEPLEKLPGISNYFIGRDPKRWRTDIPQYQRVRYEQVYPGVDVVYYGNGPQLQYDFKVEAGAEPGRIQLAFEGLQGLRIEESGDLLLETALGGLRLAKPMVYQESEAGRRPVEAGYRLLAEGRVGFTIGAYDRSRRLVIDPTLVYSTYLGGATAATVGYGVAVDAGGNAYITGNTSANDFPTVNPIQDPISNTPDVFVSKLNSTGSALVYSTYLGGNGYEIGYDIALDASGDAYVAGYTSSSDFPMVNAAQATHGGGTYDAFVAKLNSSGNSLVYSTFLGGSNNEYANGIAVNASSGEAYVAGYTESTDFPVQAAYQASSGGGRDAFVAKFNAAGVRQFSTYLGGSSSDTGTRIALDGSGDVFVTGAACSDNFPTTPGVVQTSSHGGCDAFVTKMASNGSSLVYSTYLGGSKDESAGAIAVHSSGSAYVTGYTYSSDFPTTPGAVQTSLQGYANGFVAKLNASGTALSFGTYLGGGKLDFPRDIAVDEPAGNAYITGDTYSGDFPTANALQALKANSGTVVYRSGDGGGGWSLADSGLSATSVSALSIDPGSPPTVVAGSDYGIFRTTDSGSNWSMAWGSSASVLARSPSSPSILYAAYSDSIYQSTDGGASWAGRGDISGYGVQALAVHPAISGTLYAGTSNGGVYRSVDSGATWTPVNTGLGNLFVRSLAIDPANANVLYAGTGSSVYKSTDGAASWSPAVIGMSGGSVYALAMDPGNSTVIYAVASSCIYKTTNAAATWTYMACPGSGSTSLVVAPSNPAVLYAGTYSHGVWRSADAGLTWNPANIGIVDRYIYSLAVHPTDPSVVYAGTYVTNDAFVTKMNPAGTAYVYSTYLGGSQGGSIGYGIGADSSGNAYVTGYTSSYSFPTTAGAFQRSSQTSQAFAAKISDATASCSYAVNPASQFFYSGGGTADFSVVSPSGCGWTATPGAGWIGVTNGSSGSGVGAVSISVGSNSGAARSGNLAVGGQTIAITQAASGCSYSISTSSITVPVGGDSYDLTLTAGAGCDWVVQNPYSWITVAPSSGGTGGGPFTVAVAANPNFNSRSVYIYIGGQYLNVTQAGTCVYSLSSSSAAVDWTGGARSVDVTCSGPACTWSAGSNASWLSITGYGGMGSGAVNYTVTANTTGLPRSGTLTIAGQTFTVNQEAGGGYTPFTSIYYVSPPSANGDRLVVGKMTMAAFNQLSSIPLPSLPNQMFTDVAIELAPGMFFSRVYIPTAAERMGDFSSFGGVLMDPLANMPFPGNVIPPSRLPDPFAFRIKGATTTLMDRTAFLQSTGPNVVDGFDELAVGTIDPVTSSGVHTTGEVMNSLVSQPHSFWFGAAASPPNFLFGSDFQFTFPEDVYSVGFDWSNFAGLEDLDNSIDWTIASSGGSVIDSGTVTFGGDTQRFLGFSSPLPFRTLTLHGIQRPHGGTGTWMIDDLRHAAAPLHAPAKVGTYAAGAWKLDANGSGTSDAGDENFYLGFAGAIPVTGDWNGDGRTKAGVYSNGFWFLDYDGNGVWDGGVADRLLGWGWPGATPFVGDWNGDGKTEIGVYSGGFWFLDYNGDFLWDGGVIDKQVGWGWSGVTPFVGDWNGDGKTKIGVYSNGFWFLDYDGNYTWDGGTADKQIGWGWAGTTPIVGDWNGDGKAKLGTYIGGYWFVDYDGSYTWDGGTLDKIWALGWTGTTPVIGDWSGDGKDKAGAFIDGYWYLDYNGNGAWDGAGTDRIYAFGQAGDTPVVGRW